MDPTKRFTSRVANYVRYRPSYPSDLIPLLQKHYSLPKGSEVADVGSGTGKLTEILVAAGFKTLGVEPNDAMREAAEELLDGDPNFVSVAAGAEALPFSSNALDAIFVAQAFHWFDQQRARQEFLRVLRTGAPLVIVFNNRRTHDSAFLKAYEALLLEHCPDYARVGNKHYDEKEIHRFYGGTGPRHEVLHNEQNFDYEALLGRLMSSSYAPAEGEQHDRLVKGLHNVFQEHQTNGRVQFLYACEVFHGVLQV